MMSITKKGIKMIKKLGLILLLALTYAHANYSQSILNKKIYPMGKKIFLLTCKHEINLSNFKSLDKLKIGIFKQKICKKVKGKKLEALSLYLWDIKRKRNIQNNVKVIKLKPKEKCPVCGMFVYKYPKWVAQIIYKKHNKEHRLSFDGVKDLMKFYFEPNEWGKYDNIDMKNIEIIVTDYYTQKPINGFQAFYVLRSDVYGPMGNELIPFKNEKDAKAFRLDHNAKTIITFDKITLQGVYDLDE